MESEISNFAEVYYVPISVLDKTYWVATIRVTQSSELINKQESEKFTKKNALLMVLDRSRSMKGNPWKTLVEGAKQVAERVYKLNEFDMFWTFFFNHFCAVMPTKSFEEFSEKIDKVNVLSKTNFNEAFKRIMTYCDRHKLEDLTVIFVTDGNDTWNKPTNSNNLVLSPFESLNELKHYLLAKEITSRFFTIGLSDDHDASFWSKIAQAGSDLGNFYYVDYKNKAKASKELIKECLIKTFDLGIPGGSLSAELNESNFSKRIYLSPADQEIEENKVEGEKIYETTMILDHIPEGEVELKLIGAEHSMFLNPTEIKDPDLAVKLKAESEIINQLMFDSIQTAISENTSNSQNLKRIFEKLEILNIRITQMINEGFCIKSRNTRRDIMQAWQAFKDRLFSIIETLREAIVNKESMSLTQIARLNDLAYKAIRSKGLKRKIDERALRNEEHYKALDAQIQIKIKNFDFNKIAEEHKEIIGLIGDCPLTWLTAVEALQDGDCLGIWLDVTRTEAAIADPNQLIIKDVIPTFMSCSAYLESAAYTLERQSNAHGTFDTKLQGSLATGIGRESVTGILPLFLFNEHWEIAKRTLPSIFGLLWTLDIMGYSDDQFYIIPFAVYYKLLEKVAKNQSDVNIKMLKVVKETWLQITQRHEVFRNKIVDKLDNFEVSSINRTKDWIPNFKVFIAQILWMIEIGWIDKEKYNWPKIIRFLVEEGSRRLNSKDTETHSNLSQWDYFNGKVTTKIIEKAMKIIKHPNDRILTAKEILSKLNDEEGNNLEESKEIDGLIEDEVESQPWYDRLKDDKSPAVLAIHNFNNSINKSLYWIKVFLISIDSSSVPVPENMKELEWFEEDIVVYAMLFQNMLHPSSKNRRESIELGHYVEIVTKEDAEKYLKNRYRYMLKTLISSENSKRIMSQDVKYYKNVSDQTLFIKDLSVFSNLINGLMVGNGGVSSLIKAMQNNSSLNAYEKLKVIVNMSFEGQTIFSDKYKIHPGKLKLKSKHKYWLYIRYCYNSNLISDSQFLDIFPEISEDKRIKWIKCYKAAIRNGVISV